ncbi:hypothetical protein L1887_04132 [Cichorium endivia]|nr:hypothetical protein L1887_04132 [Cichorium endivia]
MAHWCSPAVVAGGGGAFAGEAATVGAAIADSNNAIASTCSMAVESRFSELATDREGDGDGDLGLYLIS